MGLQLEDDDFYRLPKHVQEQLQSEGLGPTPPEDDIDLEQVERVRKEAIERARASIKAAQAEYAAILDDPYGDGLAPAVGQPEPPLEPP